jgi:hypothetical protein
MSLVDLVEQNLGQRQIQQLAQQIGADPQTTESAVQAALPMLLGGMADTARQPGGASAIGGLAGEHAGALDALGGLGGLAGMLGGVLGGGGGGGILGSILGRHQPTVESGVQQASGLSGDQVRRLLMILAPIVLAALARQRQQQRAAAPPAAGGGAAAVDSDHDGIPDYLEQEAQQAQARATERSPQLGGILGSILNAATRPPRR